MELKDEKWSEDLFFQVRKEVLEQWPTGSEVDLEEAVTYLQQVPESKSFCHELKKAKMEKISLAQPRAGVALVEAQIELLQYLQDEGGADLLPVTIDSYTRQNKYRECEIGICESEKQGRSMLNGFPAVNHGIKGCRAVFEAIKLPLQARHGTPDARLLSEIIHASGWTSNEGGGISYNIPYAKNISLEKSMYDWQYCDRLVGYYEDRGININREPFGPLTGTLVPPSISNAVAIVEGLLAARQGVRNITLGYGASGNLIQDVAAIKALIEQAEEYFQTYDYEVDLTTVLHEFMGGFPADEAKAFGVISWGAAVAALAGVTKVIVKTPHEALGIPTKEANAQGIKTTKQILNLLRGQRLPMSNELKQEIQCIKAETECILGKVLELGKGDLAVGSVNAFKVGVLDIPFAPSRYNAGKVIPARDNYGAIRYLKFGNLPFSQDLKDYNRSLLAERAKHEGREEGFQLVVDDIYAVSEGFLTGRPENLNCNRRKEREAN